MYFAQQHPELVSQVITLDNLRVPFVLNEKVKILSFRSEDPKFKTDPGVLPTVEQAWEDGIDIVKTNAQHADMSDRGPDLVKEKIQATLDHFLSDSWSSEPSAVDTEKLIVSNPGPTAPP